MRVLSPHTCRQAGTSFDFGHFRLVHRLNFLLSPLAQHGVCVIKWMVPHATHTHPSTGTHALIQVGPTSFSPAFRLCLITETAIFHQSNYETRLSFFHLVFLLRLLASLSRPFPPTRHTHGKATFKHFCCRPSFVSIFMWRQIKSFDMH